MSKGAWHVRVAVFALAVFAMTADARGQEREPLRQPTAIPAELASALIAAGGFGMTGDPQILVGELPEWVVSRIYLPHGARILGSAFFGSTVVGVVIVPSDGDSVLTMIQNELRERGWTPPPIPQGAGGGFRPARASVSAQGMISDRPTLCRDQHTLTMWLSRQQAMTSTIIMRLGSAGTSACNPPRFMGQTRPSPFPTLYNPAGAEGDMMSMRECYSSGMGSSSTQTRLKTTMSPGAILDHYARQLQDSGWTNAADQAIVGRTWIHKDSAGSPRILTLTVKSAQNDTTCRTVELGVQSTREP